MGLSNEERIQGILHSIRRIQPLARTLNIKEALYSILKEQCENLWAEAFRNVSNSSHWILGSSTEDTVRSDTETPWGLAVKAGIQDCREQTEIEKKLDRPGFMDRFTIYDFIRARDENLSIAYSIYQEIENIIYSLRRYSDAFLEHYESLSVLASKMMGTCFEIFYEERDTCTKAYLLHNILDNLLSFPYCMDDESHSLAMDMTTRFFNELKLSFLICEPMSPNSVVTTKELALMYKGLISREETTEAKKFEKNLFLLIRLCNRKLHYCHTQEEIRKFVKESKLKIDKAALEKLLDEAVALSDKKEMREGKVYQDHKKFNEEYLYEEIK